MIIFSSQKSEQLANEVAIGLKAQLGEREHKIFPDGEIYVRILTPVKGEEVVLIHTTQNNNDLVELLLTLSALRQNSAKKITCIVPHMIYQRQDEAFLDGEAVSAKLVLELISKYADKIITVTAHFMDEAGEGKFGGAKVTNLDAFPLLGKYFAGVKDLVIISPDEGAMKYAKAAGEAVGCPYDNLIKKRIDGEHVEMQPKKLCVKGKNVVILDDIISTGGTMKKAAEMLISQGAKSVALGCVHGVFTKGTDIFGSLEVVCTNSIPTKLSKVSLAPIIIKTLKG
jgi:ribose-phosphate pyrophosphokinase